MCMCKNNHSTSLEAFEDWSLHAKYIFIYDPYLLLGGIRSLSQSQGFAFSPLDCVFRASSLCQSLALLSPCIGGETQELLGIILLTFSDMGFSLKWVVPHVCWFLSADGTSTPIAGSAAQMPTSGWENPTRRKLLITPVGPEPRPIHFRA